MIAREYVVEREPFGEQDWKVVYTPPEGDRVSYISPDTREWVEADDRLWWRLCGKYEASLRLRGYT
jgi:hypothetical protein